MPSHLSIADEWLSDVAVHDEMGNDFADKFVGEAAEPFKLSS